MAAWRHSQASSQPQRAAVNQSQTQMISSAGSVRQGQGHVWQLLMPSKAAEDESMQQSHITQGFASLWT